MWPRQVFVRNPNDELNNLYGAVRHASGVYLIGCADEIVYVGQSWNLHERPFESLGRVYHRVPDTSVPWSMALAPCAPREIDERESTAIIAYAPKFNTSIPSIPKSQGRMPEIIGVASVFQDQTDTGRAFEPENLSRQQTMAASNPSPPWRQGTQWKKTGKREKEPDPQPTTEPAPLTAEEIRELWEYYGVPLTGPLPYKVNLCDDGSVVTKYGEVIGSWSMDQDEFPSFTPNGAASPSIQHVWVGLLCNRIADWYEAQSGETISD